MTSPAQIQANQNNALASTGPRTLQGKAASSQNSLTHALTGGFCILPQEDQAEYDRQFICYKQEFRPRSEHETFLVELMVQARWSLKRTYRLQAQVVERMVSAGAPGTAD